ncbi:hypothetical protein QR680_017243 [Steinernema hermaphroditum]|uniref:BZIP domain-containing protein n=1 Tax=Steinernema hermaphroditum TaxID=289476 RepID=A0AA39HG20_9BILA|nr:hypothetical protein QR680_017243 [Steinernema hermaphroditum]
MENGILDRMIFELDMLESRPETPAKPSGKVVEGLFCGSWSSHSPSSLCSHFESPPSISGLNSPSNCEFLHSRCSSTGCAHSLELQRFPEQVECPAETYSQSAPLENRLKPTRAYNKVPPEQKTAAYLAQREKASKYVRRSRQKKKEAERDKDQKIATLQERLREEQEERIRQAAINDTLRGENERLLKELCLLKGNSS